MKALFAARSLRVLMYHKVLPDKKDMLTVSCSQLEEHLQYIQTSGYQILKLSEALQTNNFPKRAVVLTFDDAYENNLEYAYPILKKYNAKATIFVPSKYVGTNSSWDNNPARLMSIEQLKNLDKDVFELGLHTHTHTYFGKLNAEQIHGDLRQNIAFFQQNQLPFIPALAYPYGGRPTDKSTYEAMLKSFRDLGVKSAFRIGNRHNVWPLQNPYEIERIDVRGTDSMAAFKRKLRWGKIF